MKTAFIFPGQGAQYEGMCRDIYETYDSAKVLLDSAREFLPENKLPFELSLEELSQTKFAQPALFLHSAAVYEIIKDTDFSCVAGFSLGECTSLYVSGILSFEDTLKLIVTRATRMDAAAKKNPGTMFAILGGDDTAPALITEVCADITKSIGYVAPVNFNCLGQTVIAGSEAAAEEAAARLKENYSFKAMKLKTSGAFHCGFMNEAAAEFEDDLKAFNFSAPKMTIYSNKTGKTYSDDQLSDMPKYLASHIINPVKWNDIVANMIADGIDSFVEIGCGKTLSGFIKRIDKEKQSFNTDTAESIKEFLETIKNI